MKKRDDQERRMQKGFLLWFNSQYPRFKFVIHHSPNGGYRRIIEARNFKLMGTQPGIPDIMIFVQRMGYGGLFIELKVPGRYPSKDQKEVINHLIEQGYKVEVVHSLEAAIDLTNWYFGRPSNIAQDDKDAEKIARDIYES